MSDNYLEVLARELVKAIAVKMRSERAWGSDAEAMILGGLRSVASPTLQRATMTARSPLTSTVTKCPQCRRDDTVERRGTHPNGEPLFECVTCGVFLEGTAPGTILEPVTMPGDLARERVAAVFYVLMRDHGWGAMVAMTQLTEAVEAHGRKVEGRADFTDKVLAHEARRLARRLLTSGGPVTLKVGE